MLKEKFFVVALREHNYLGHILNAYFVQNEPKKDFFVNTESVKGENEKSLISYQKEIVRLINQFSDSELLRVFSKKKKISIQDFFTSMDSEFFNIRIQPYLENRIRKILDIILINKIPFYYRTSANIHRDDEIILSDSKAEAVFNFIKEADYTKYFLSIRQNGSEMSLLDAHFLALVKEPAYALINSKLYYFTDIDSNKLKPFLNKEFVRINKSAEKAYYEKFVLRAMQRYSVNAKGFNIEYFDNEPEMRLIFSTALNGKFSFIPHFYYGENYFLPKNKQNIKVWLESNGDEYKFFRLERNIDKEKEWLQKLKDFDLFEQTENNYFVDFTQQFDNLKDYNYEVINWLNDRKHEIEQLNIQIVHNYELEKFYTSSIQLQVETKKKNDWFDIYAIVNLKGYEISFIKLKENILSGNREYKLPDGKIIILPKVWFEKFSSIFEVSKEIMGHLHIDKHHAILLEDIEEIDASYFKSLQSIYTKKTAIIESPKGLKASLRTYQQDGFSWMVSLMNENLGACLADDMGLGKTVQTLALLQFLKEKIDKSAKKKQQLSLFDTASLQSNESFLALVVMPTSLVYNWINEIEQFIPENKVMVYGGSNRDLKIKNIRDFDIIISSYGVIRNDFEKLQNINFDVVVLDESQYIKNPSSKIYKAVESINASKKIVLTGTPIENSLSDLWAQINFINPGLLGNFNYFKEKFLYQIEKHNDEHVKQKFKKLVTPFILRRTKREVAKDLPELTEQTRYCELSEEHQEIYDAEKSKIRNYILSSKMDSDFWKKSGTQIFQSISRLRQLANHVELVFPEKNIESEKFVEIFRVIDAIIKENNKVLIFSSYVKILRLFEKYFVDNNQQYSLLTGDMSKNEREKNIQIFQKNANVNTFLLSIKAGGVGLNLTEADYVIIIDPWWNPATEAQAISRAHRIGQTNNILAYRFISKNTIEQKIQILQNKKRNLSQDVLNLEKDLQLNAEEIKALFE